MSTKRRGCQNDDEPAKKAGIPKERQPRAMKIMNIIKCCPWQRKQTALRTWIWSWGPGSHKHNEKCEIKLTPRNWGKDEPDILVMSCR